MKLFITFIVYSIGKSISKFSFNIRMILLNIQIFSDIFKRDEDQNLLPNHHHSFDPINQKLPQLDPRFPSGMDQSVATVLLGVSL